MSNSHDHKLSPQECRVIELIAAGCTNEQIAQVLGISKATTNSYVRNILQKLRVANRAAAVARYYGYQRGTS
jgi:two-component system response regulator DegU